MADEDLQVLDATTVRRRLSALPGWKFADDKITKTYEFKSFSDAILFVNGLVSFCNYIDHHPDIIINYKKVRFELTRYSVGNKVTARDFVVAKKIADDYHQYEERKVS